MPPLHCDPERPERRHRPPTCPLQKDRWACGSTLCLDR